MRSDYNYQQLRHNLSLGQWICTFLGGYLALGEYENGRIEFPGLGSRLKYDPGTIVTFMGRLAT